MAANLSVGCSGCCVDSETECAEAPLLGQEHRDVADEALRVLVQRAVAGVRVKDRHGRLRPRPLHRQLSPAAFRSSPPKTRGATLSAHSPGHKRRPPVYEAAVSLPPATRLEGFGA